MVKPSTLYEIIADYAPTSQTLLRVGLVGSYAREEAGDKSDVDLVFDTGDTLSQEAILSAGLGIRGGLRNQFNINTDIINYNTIIKKVSQPGQHPIEARGYELMLEDLKWIWRRA